MQQSYSDMIPCVLMTFINYHKLQVYFYCYLTEIKLSVIYPSLIKIKFGWEILCRQYEIIFLIEKYNLYRIANVLNNSINSYFKLTFVQPDRELINVNFYLLESKS